MTPLLRAVLLASSILPFTFAAKQCYWSNFGQEGIDGAKADGQYPCDDGDGDSPCCADDEVCLSNGLCFNGRVMGRGGCTDKTWGSSRCTKICSKDFLYSGVHECEAAGKFSCIWGECGDDQAFDVQPGTLILNDHLTSSLNLDGPTATVTSAANTVTTTATVGGASKLPASDSDAEEHSLGVSTGAAAGIALGIAIPLLITTVAGVAMWLRERRKVRALELKVAGGVGPGSMGGGDGHSSAPHYAAQGENYYEPKGASEYHSLGHPPPSHEMGGQGQVPELGTGTVPELSGDSERR